MGGTHGEQLASDKSKSASRIRAGYADLLDYESCDGKAFRGSEEEVRRQHTAEGRQERQATVEAFFCGEGHPRERHVEPNVQAKKRPTGKQRR